MYPLHICVLNVSKLLYFLISVSNSDEYIYNITELSVKALNIKEIRGFFIQLENKFPNFSTVSKLVWLSYLHSASVLHEASTNLNFSGHHLYQTWKN